jgi:outer membrane protein OmpA-like peptidoglycan-associated protein
MNVYGDRLRSNPSATIELVGSAPAQADGLTMANNVKDYLVSTFGIDPARISTRGSKRAPHESGTRATPKEDLGLVAEENFRVEILSSDNNILKPVKIETLQSDIVDNDLVISVGASGAVADWTVQVTGEGIDKTYGPYRTSSQRIDARPILMDRSSGNYTAKVVARTADNQTIEKTQNFSLVRRTEPPVAGTRFSILFEYDESKTVSTYDQFLRQEVAPNIPAGSTVVIYGHTDRIGIDDHNYELSTRRATEAMNVLQDELNKLGRSVKFDTYGFGENEERAPFMNNAPETRYYNRTVLIEVIPNS